jgi:hypothetical protein
MRDQITLTFPGAALFVTVSSGLAISGSDKYTVRVSNGKR